MPPSGIDSAIENDFDINNIEKYSEYNNFAISCITLQKVETYKILHAIKSEFKDKTVIIGGPHAKYYYIDDCIKEPFDYIIIAETVSLPLKPLWKVKPRKEY